MGLLDNARRWIKDRNSYDQDIAGNPQKALRELEKYVDNMVPHIRSEQAEHVRAGFVVYYTGRHNEPVPQKTMEQLHRLDRRIEKLNLVDEHRAILRKHGGPPTYETVQRALDRSLQAALTLNKVARKEGTNEPSKAKAKTFEKSHEHTA